MDRSISAHKGLEPFALTSCPAHIKGDIYNKIKTYENDVKFTENLVVLYNMLKEFCKDIESPCICFKDQLSINMNFINDNTSSYWGIDNFDVLKFGESSNSGCYNEF